MVLWVLLAKFPGFISSSSHFLSPILVGCLLTYLIFAVTIWRINRTGNGEAITSWAREKVVLKAQGSMAFSLWGQRSVS